MASPREITLDQRGIGRFGRERQVLLECRFGRGEIGARLVQQAQRTERFRRCLEHRHRFRKVVQRLGHVVLLVATAVDLAARVQEVGVLGLAREQPVEQHQALFVLAALDLVGDPVEAQRRHHLLQFGRVELAATVARELQQFVAAVAGGRVVANIALRVPTSSPPVIFSSPNRSSQTCAACRPS